jgi:hypothetical protein
VRERLGRLRRRGPLPSLYDRYPRADQALRRPRGLQVVPLDEIVGTVRNPTQNTADFLPLPQLRGRNWMARWQRIREAMDQLTTLPSVDLVQVGEEYYVSDGHNRVAAARQAGAAVVDADVVELVLPGTPSSSAPHRPDAATILVGAGEVRQAAAGRQSRSQQRRLAVDEIRREDLLTPDGAQGGAEDAGAEPEARGEA